MIGLQYILTHQQLSHKVRGQLQSAALHCDNDEVFEEFLNQPHVLTKTVPYSSYSHETCKNGISFIVAGRHNKITRPGFKHSLCWTVTEHNQLQWYCPWPLSRVKCQNSYHYQVLGSDRASKKLRKTRETTRTASTTSKLSVIRPKVISLKAFCIKIRLENK